jgi:tetrahydromethanopterin S-methyltransferase subunit G
MTARKMVNLNIEETSGVDHPAHLDEGWILMKNADLTTEDFETIEKMVALEADLAKAHERIAELEAQQIADPEEPADDDEEALIKSAPAPVREALEKARKQADEATEALRKERDLRLDAEAIVKSEERFANLTVDHADFGPAMRRLAEIAPEISDTIFKALDAANGQAESANIFAEIGNISSPNSTNAYQKIESIAKAKVANGEFPTTEQAISAVISTNPSLYAEYQAENR